MSLNVQGENMGKQVCQSCGMPLSQDPKNGGTNADGTLSKKYCSYCYLNGKFQGPMTSPKEMQKFCIEKLVEKKTPRVFAWMLTRRIPHLERWKYI